MASYTVVVLLKVRHLKFTYLVPLLLLSACSWFHHKPVTPDPTELVVNGAPAGSVLFVDGAAAAPENPSSVRPQVVIVAPGMHTVEVHLEDKVSYRESTYVAPGEKHVIIVLSGSDRN